MRIPIYILIVALIFFAPVDRVDVGHLRPIEVVALYEENGQMVLRTDTGDQGRGENVDAALADMKATAPAVIYLDTAKYVLIDQKIEQRGISLRRYLKPDVRVCLTQGEIDLSDAGKYLEVQGNLVSLKNWKPGEITPILTGEK